MLKQTYCTFFMCFFVIYLCLVCVYDKYIFESVLLMNSILGSEISFKRDPNYEKAYNLDKVQDKLNKTSHKIILVWTPAFGGLILNPRMCKDCLITHDRRAIEKADAVAFHCVETRDSSAWLPWKHRNPRQRWVWMCMEPPWHVRYVFHKTLTSFNRAFNWTMTYRRDSDVFMPYMMKIPPINKTISEIIKDKNSNALGAWVVSNCHSNERSQLIANLSNYIKIDVYGKCSGKHLCRGECEKNVLYKYKFYFAFENSRCKDYITEKFWRKGLSYYTVPVVLGPSREDYEVVAPPHSFIHVDDFDSAESLAKYLTKLDEDDRLYGEYLRWMSATERHNDWFTDVSKIKPKDSNKGLIKFKEKSFSSYCQLCSKLHEAEPPKVIEQLDQWWFGQNYDTQSEKFSVCSPLSGQSGYSHRWQVTLGYSLLLFVFFVVCLCCGFRIRPPRFIANMRRIFENSSKVSTSFENK